LGVDDEESLAPDDQAQRREVLINARDYAEQHHEQLPEQFKKKDKILQKVRKKP
jgi:hypothetical protein